jgi:hypothetical protein
VPGQAQQIAAERCDINRDFPHCLSCICVKNDSARTAQIGDLGNRLQCTDFVIGQHHRDECRIIGQYSVNAGRIDYPVRFDRDNVNAEAILPQGERRGEHAFMLDRHHHHMVAAARHGMN